MDLKIKIYTGLNTYEYTYAEGILELPSSLSSSIDILSSSIETSMLTFELNNKEKNGSTPLKDFTFALNDNNSRFLGTRVELFKKNSVIYKGIVHKMTTDIYSQKVFLETKDGVSMLNTRLFARELSEYKDLVGTLETPALATQRLPTNFSCVERDIDPKDASKGKKRVIVYSGGMNKLVEGIFIMVYSQPKVIAGESYDNTFWKEVYDEIAVNNLDVGQPYFASSIVCYYEWDEQLDNAFEFLKEYIFKPGGYYMLRLENGKISFERHNKPQTTNKTISEDMYYEITSLEFKEDDIINYLTSESRYSFADDFNYKRDTYVSKDSYDLSLELLPSSAFSLNYKAFSKDANTDTEIQTYVDNVKDIYFNRFNGIYLDGQTKKFSLNKVIQISMPFDLSYVVGEFINFTNSKMLDFKDPTKTLSGGIIMQIIEIENDFANDTTSLTLFYSNNK